MRQVIAKQWVLRKKNLLYTKPYQALIVASMIEKEVKVAGERSKVAAVILRRLKKKMRLQIDVTVLYGQHKPYGTTITKQDLKTKTPYNTYTRYGLPPTPIAMPSEASIFAALHPSNGTALYYVARGDGTQVFSNTYQQHLSAVNQYQRGEQKTLKFQPAWLDMISVTMGKGVLMK